MPFIDTTTVPCDFCIVQDAEVVVTLADGQCWEVCKLCVEEVIRDNATTDNPVHEMVELDKGAEA